MSQKALYQLSARQILLLAFASALIAVGAVLFVNNLGTMFQPKNGNVILAEENTPAKISTKL